MEEKHIFIILLSDTHVGRITESYDVLVFKRRLGQLREKIVRAKKQINRSFPLPNCYVFFLGDLIDNESNWREHPFEISMSVEEQVELAKDEFASFIMGLKPYFRNINVYAVMGNHGSPKKIVRSPKTNWDYVLYRWLEDVLSSDYQINFEVEDSWYGIAEIGKFKVLYTHGDCVQSYHGIPIYGLMRRAMMWKSGDLDFDNVFIGHWHVPSYIVMNRLQLYINGSFLTDDPYSLRKGFVPRPAQWVIVVNRDGEVAWQKLIYLD